MQILNVTFKKFVENFKCSFSLLSATGLSTPTNLMPLDFYKSDLTFLANPVPLMDF